jgi:hypothetical protein
MGRKAQRLERDVHGLEGVVTFFGSYHALRAEKSLLAAGLRAVLIPGPREISPNCGTALRFDYALEEEARRILEESLVQYEEIHHYPA